MRKIVVHWLRLPEHLRRGLLRLYFAVTVPWVAWFGYQILDGLQRPYYSRWRYVSPAFWSLLIVPIGGPILFLLIVWVAVGFRKSTLGLNEARPGEEGGYGLPPSAEARGTRVSPEVEAIFKKFDRLLDDEKAQIDGLPEPFRSEVLRGADCDEITDAAGEFGRDHRNPIPANGPLGEMIYLSNLRTTTSQQIIFHRLGSVRNVDAYETVSVDGAVWDVLFLDLYHPRKSRRAPAGYRIAAGAERERLLFGANEFVAAFPDQLLDAIANTNERLLGGRMRPRQVREAIEQINFKRPSHHLIRFNSVMAMLEAKAGPRPLTEFCGRITESQLQASVERIDKGDLSKPGKILFMLIAMAAAHFWNQTLKFENLNSSFFATNSDVVIVEVLYLVWCLLGKMMLTDFNAALVVAETDERRARVPKTEMGNLIALRTALELMDAQIEAKTGWDVENVKASRLKEYGGMQGREELISAFTRRILSSIGKQSIHDEDTDGFGPFASEDTKLTMAVTVWFAAMPTAYYEAFKNSHCAP